jgi:cytochrome c oxidase assembly protein subunit 15
MHPSSTTVPVPAWLRAWAVLTVLAAIPLAILGAEVTTKGVGMVDPVGFRSPLHLFTQALPEGSWLGYVIEHGHRVAGFLVGTCCIVLAVGLGFFARGAFYRSLGVVALLAVIAQGMLGIFRVDLNALFGRDLAMIHGAFAQLVFATLTAVAVLVSRTWSSTATAPYPGTRGMALALCVVLYVQIVFGAITRHRLDPLAQRLHILLAFAAVLLVFWLLQRLRDNRADRASLRFGYVLAAVVLLQPILGVEAWISRFGAGVLPELVASTPWSDLVRSGHHFLGTIIFCLSVAVAVLLRRPIPLAADRPLDSRWLDTAIADKALQDRTERLRVGEHV